MKLSYWRFIIPLAFQVTIVASIAFVPLSIVLTGKTVILRTAAFDPYDLLRGYSQVLTYDFSLLDNLKKLPGGKELKNNQEFYLIFVAPENTNSIPPLPWQPIGVVDTLPSNLPPNQIAIKGKLINEFVIDYGIEELYIPEAQRDQINQDVNEANRQQAGAVEVKVGPSGRAILRSLWIGSSRYEF